jgi:hypothetical protein
VKKPCCEMHIPGPGVVPKPLPGSQYLVFGGTRESLQGWILRDKLFVIGNSLCYLRLLQDDLRQPDFIRVLCSFPWHWPRMVTDPIDDIP